jgi:hypothetical protein
MQIALVINKIVKLHFLQAVMSDRVLHYYHEYV